jgi:hypothetical protein
MKPKHTSIQTRGLVSNLSHLQINKTKQHTHTNTRISIGINKKKLKILAAHGVCRVGLFLLVLHRVYWKCGRRGSVLPNVAQYAVGMVV